MSLSSGNPEVGLKTSGNSSQIGNQREGSPVGTDIKCRLDNDMPNYFAQASFGLRMGLLGLISDLLTCGEIYIENVMAPGEGANCT